MQVTIILKLENGYPGGLSFLTSSLYNYICYKYVFVWYLIIRFDNKMEMFDNKNGKVYHITVPI